MIQTTAKNKVIIGSRESRLAVLQSEMVRDYIKEQHPGLDVEILTMKTTGDKILDRTLDKVGGKGLFVKELDKALLEGRTMLSVHSLKDMPMEESEELPILAGRPAAACFFQKRGSERCSGAAGGCSQPGSFETSGLFQSSSHFAAANNLSGYESEKYQGKSSDKTA